MELNEITAFFRWATIIDAIILFFSAIMIANMPIFVYKMQKKAYSITREQFNIVAYAYLAIFKTFFIFFNLVPLIALYIMGGK